MQETIFKVQRKEARKEIEIIEKIRRRKNKEKKLNETSKRK
jgi:hypothetical protein